MDTMTMNYYKHIERAIFVKNSQMCEIVAL